MKKITLKSFKIIKKHLLVISVGLVLASCGGGGSSSKGDSSSPSVSDFTGRALKGPVQDGKVICYDKDGNVVDFTFTNKDGNFKLKKTCPAGGKLVLRGGKDKSTGLIVEEMVSLPGSKFITPLSTMQYIYKDKQYNLKVKEAGSEKLLEQSGNLDPKEKSKEAREMTKANLVLDSVVKIIQRSSDSEITYFDGMKFVLNELKDKDIAALGRDDSAKAKTMIDGLFTKFGFKEQTKDVNDLIERKGEDLQEKDYKEEGLKDVIPQQLRVPFRYVGVVKESLDGSSYKVTFDKLSESGGDDYDYKCKLFEKKAGERIGYRKKDAWNDKSYDCLIAKPVTLDKADEGKYLVIRYSKKGADSVKNYGYSQPYQIGSIHAGKNSKIEFATSNGKVYLPIDGKYIDKNIDNLGDTEIADLETNSKALGYLPVGFYYKPNKVASSKFDNVRFGVKLEIGDKEIVMMMDRLFIKRWAMESSRAENPYLHGVLGNAGSVTGRSTYSYTVGSNWNSRLVSDDSSYRSDYNNKNGFLRFKSPVKTGGDNLNMADQAKLSNNLIGVSLYDICNQKLVNLSTRSTATVCNYIRSTINAEEATAVTITPFVKSENGNRNSYELTTNRGSINLNGITGLYTFPPVKIKGKPETVKKIAGKNGLEGIDSDGDGVSDYDEMNLGRNPFKAESADTDTDGDGISDINEMKLGMDAATKDFEFKVSPNVVDIVEGGVEKNVTITLRASAKVKTEVELDFENNAKSVVTVATSIFPIDKNKVIKIVPKKSFAINIKNPAILVKAVLINGANRVQVGVKKIKLTSKDFSYLLTPTSVAFNYKNSSGSPSNPLITGTKLRVGGEIEASPSAPSGFNSSFEVKYQWQHSSNGNDYIDISDATSAIYKVTTTDAGKFIGVKIAYLKKVNPAYTISQAPRKDVPSTVNKIAVNPMAPATKPTLTSDATNVYPISTVTMTTTAKAGMEIVRRWKFDGTYKASGGKFESAKELLVPSDTKIGTKISGCYAYKVNGATSDFTCSDEVTVVKDTGIIERIKSVSIQNGAGKKLDKVSALLNDKGYLFAPDKVYVLVELPFAIKKLPESVTKLVISNGTDELVAKAAVSEQVAINAFAVDNKSKLVFMLDLLGKEDSFVGKKYSLKSFSAKVTKADNSGEVKLSHSEASKSVYQKFDIVYKGLDSTVVPVIKNGDTDNLFNNKKASVGDVLRGEFKIASSATAIERFYKWEKTNYVKRPKNDSPYTLNCDNDGWREIATSTSAKYTVGLGDDYSCIRVSGSAKKDGKPTGELTYNKGGSTGTVRIDSAMATTPTIKSANDPSKAEFYLGETVVATKLANKNGYKKVYVWQTQTKETTSKWQDIASETSTTYTPSEKYHIDKLKLRFCYRYENDKFYSATVCSAVIKLRLSDVKISSNNVQWGTDVTFDVANDKEYRLFKDGSENVATSTGISLKVSGNKGTISAIKSGSVKLQNRVKKTSGVSAGDWTAGVEVTFVVQPSPATISAPTQVVYEGIPFDLSTLISSNTEPQNISFVKSSGDNIANFDYKPNLVALGGSHGKSAVYTITFAKSHKYDTKSVNVTIKAMRIYKPSLAVLSGTPVTGETLSLKVATPPAGYSVYYAWQNSRGKSSWTDITGATGSKPSYTLSKEDANHYIRVKAQYVKLGMTDSLAATVEVKDKIKLSKPKDSVKVSATTETWGTDITVATVSGQEYRIRATDGSSVAPSYIKYDDTTGVISASRAGTVKLQTRNKRSGVESDWTAGITITFTIKPSQALLSTTATTVKEGETLDLSTLITNTGGQFISYTEASDPNNIGSLNKSIVTVADKSHGKSATYTITFAEDTKYALKEFTVTITAEKHDGVKRLSLSGNKAVDSTLTAVVVGATPTGFTTVYKWERSTASGYETIGSNSPKYKLVDNDKDKFIKLSVWHENSGMTNTDVVSVTTASRIKPKMPNDEAKTVGGIYRTEYGNDITVVMVSGQEYEIFDKDDGVSAPFDKVKFDKTTGVISATGFGDIKLRTRVKATAGVANALPSDWTAGVDIKFTQLGSSLVKITGDSTVGETLTMDTDAASPGYTINYEWYRVADAYDKNSWVLITGQKAKTYTLTTAELDKYIGGKVWYTKAGYKSLERSSTTTVKVRPATRATETKTDKDTAQWGTDITFTSSNTDEYRLVATDGTPNKPSSTGISLNVSGNKGTISATKSGIVKLQTRVKAGGATDTRPSVWTAGATVTFTRQQSSADLSSTVEMVTEGHTFDLSTLVATNAGSQAISYAEASDPNNIGSLSKSVVTVAGDSDGKAVIYTMTFAENAKYATKAIDVKIIGVRVTGPKSAVVSGDLTVGGTLKVTVATIAGYDNKYQWQYGDNKGSWADIASANNSTYKLQRSDVNKFIAIKVWYAKSGMTDSDAGTWMQSLSVRPAIPSIEATTVNSISKTGIGTDITVATVSGQEYRIRTANGEYPAPSHITYDKTTGVISATSKGTIVLQTRVASDTNVAGSRPSAWTAGVAITFVVEAPKSVAVSGIPTVGELLTATASDLTGYDLNYQWQRSEATNSGWTDISGANSATYTLNGRDANKHIRAKVWYVSSDGTELSVATFGNLSLIVKPAVPSEGVPSAYTAEWGMDITVATVSSQDYRLVGTDGATNSVPSGITLTYGVIEASQSGSVKLQTRVASDKNVAGSRPSDWTAGVPITFTLRKSLGRLSTTTLTLIEDVTFDLSSLVSANTGSQTISYAEASDPSNIGGLNGSIVTVATGSQGKSATYTITFAEDDKYALKKFAVTITAETKGVVPSKPIVSADTAEWGTDIMVVTMSYQDYRLVGTDGATKSVPSGITLTNGIIKASNPGSVKLQTRFVADKSVSGSSPSAWTSGATITFTQVMAKVKFALKTTKAPNTTKTGGGNYKTYLIENVDYANPGNQPVTMTTDSASVTIVKRDNMPWNYLDGLSDANRPDVVYTFNTTSGGKPVKRVPLLIYIRNGVKVDVKVNFADTTNYEAQSIAATLENRFALPSFADIASSVNPEWEIDLSKLFTVPNGWTQAIDYVEATDSNNVAELNGSVVTIAKSSAITEGDFASYKVKFVEDYKYIGGEFVVKLTARASQAKPTMEAISATTVGWNTPVNITIVPSQDYRLVSVGTDAAPTGVTLKNGIITSSVIDSFKLQTRKKQTPTKMASDWTDGATINFTKAMAKVKFVLKTAEAPNTTNAGNGNYKFYAVARGSIVDSVEYANPHNQPITMTTDSKDVTIVQQDEEPWSYIDKLSEASRPDVVYSFSVTSGGKPANDPILIYIRKGVAVDVKLNFAEKALYKAQSIAGTLANRIALLNFADIATSVDPGQVINLSKLLNLPDSVSQTIEYSEVTDSNDVATIKGSEVTISPSAMNLAEASALYKVKFVQDNKYAGGEFDITLTVRTPQPKPTMEAISATTVGWNIPITIDTVATQEYRIVSVGTDAAPVGVTVKNDTIKSTVKGLFKLQTRKKETLTRLASAWTDGATITYTKAMAKVRFKLNYYEAPHNFADFHVNIGSYRFYSIGRGGLIGNVQYGVVTGKNSFRKAVSFGNPGGQPVTMTADSASVTIVKRDYYPWDYIAKLLKTATTSLPDVIYSFNVIGAQYDDVMIFVRRGVTADVKLNFAETEMYKAQSVSGTLANKFDHPSIRDREVPVALGQTLDLSKFFSLRTVSEPTDWQQKVIYTEESDSANIATLKGSLITIATSSSISNGDFATYKVKFVDDSKYKGGEFKVKVTIKESQKAPTNEATSPTTVVWNVPVTFTPVATQEYRLVGVVGANGVQKSVPRGISLGNGVINVNNTGSVKLQTRMKETPTKQASAWTNGATITFVKAPSPARFALSVAEASRDIEGSSAKLTSTYINSKGHTLYSTKFYNGTDMGYYNPGGQPVSMTSQDATVVKENLRPWRNFLGQHYGAAKKADIVYSFDVEYDRYSRYKGSKQLIFVRRGVTAGATIHFAETNLYEATSVNVKLSATKSKANPPKLTLYEGGFREFDGYFYVGALRSEGGRILKDKEYRVVGIDGGSPPAPIKLSKFGWDYLIEANAPAVGLIQVRQLASPKYEASGWVSTRFEFTKKKQSAPTIEATTVGATAKAEWGTDITVATVSGQEYRIVVSDGATGSVPSHIKYDAKSGIISATAAGVIKLQTRMMEGTSVQPSAWTNGVTITFVTKTTSISSDIKLAKVIRTRDYNYSDGDITYSNGFNQPVNAGAVVGAGDSVYGTGDSVYGIVARSNDRIPLLKLDNNTDIAYSYNVTGEGSRLVY